MKGFGVAIAITCAVIIAAVAAWRVAYPTYSHRFRLTVEVDTPLGLKVGSSVIEVRTITYPRWITLGNNDHETKIHGDAVFVDLGQDHHVIAVLAHGPFADKFYISEITARVFAEAERRKLSQRQVAELLSRRSGKADLELSLIPTLLTFRDLHDSKSALVVPPHGFEETFGARVRLKRVGVELTNDAVTRGIERRLPFLDRVLASQGRSIRGRARNLNVSYPLFVRN